MSEVSQDWHELFQEWCIAMEQSLRGFTTLSNLLYDVLEERIPKSTLREILEDVATRWKDDVERSSRDSRQPKHPHRVFEEAVEKAIEKAEKAEKRTCLCQGTAAPHALPPKYSRVVATMDFKEHNLELGPGGLELAGGPMTARDVRLVKAALKHQLEYPDEPAITKGSIRGKLPLAWVTKTKVLTKLKEDTRESYYADEEPRYAHSVRKHLGLSHLKDDRVIEIKYPNNGKVNGRRLSVPTALEGCFSLRFRAKTGKDGWGRAVHLETGNDGFPEAVHEEIDFTREFVEIEDLGDLSPLDQKAKEDKEDLLKNLLKIFKTLLDRKTLLEVWKFRYPWTSDSYRDLLNYVQ